jgi:hypothetical protein
VALDYTIWIEAERWAVGEWEPNDAYSSVNVAFTDGSRWYAFFISYANITTLREKNEHTGENLHGRYFRADSMILVDQVSRQRIDEVVAYLVATGEFSSAFERLPPPDEDGWS